MKELLVQTNDRNALDKILQSLGGLVSEKSEGLGDNRFYAVRSISGNIEFLKYAICNQGYAKIVGERDT